MRLAIRRFWGWISRIVHPQISACGRCGMSWHWTEGHETMVTTSRGLFPLCQWCWGQLTPEDRLPFYEALYRQWPHLRPYPWAAVREAVLGDH